MQLKFRMKSFVMLLSLLAMQLPVFSQTAADTLFRRHNIKIDLTTHVLYREALVFSYEMALNPSQSFVVSFGPQDLPSLNVFNTDWAVKETKSSGFKLGGEYRFYLKKENKHPAPHGVYVGPYMSYLMFNNEKNIRYDNNGVQENLDLDLNLQVLNLGAQIGYQFVIKNRITIDMVFIGPSMSNYSARASVKGDFSLDPDEVTNEVLLALIEKFPGLSDLIDVDEELVSNGRVNNWALGFRYQLHVGYLFGFKSRKKP